MKQKNININYFIIDISYLFYYSSIKTRDGLLYYEDSVLDLKYCTDVSQKANAIHLNIFGIKYILVFSSKENIFQTYSLIKSFVDGENNI